MRRWSCTSAWRGSGEPALAVLPLASSMMHRARASWRKACACGLHGVRHFARVLSVGPLRFGQSLRRPPALALDSLACRWLALRSH